MGRHKITLELGIAYQQYVDGKSLVELGHDYGISSATVKRIFKDAGYNVRPRKEAMKLAGKQGKLARTSHRERNPQWKGGVIMTGGGYRALLRPDHYRARKSGYVLEHILVWEQAHGRQLPEGWVIHHLNGIVTDNRPENLLGLPTSKHDNYIPLLKQRIRMLEAEVGRLRRALENNQLILLSNEN